MPCPNRPMAPGTKWAFSSALYAYGSPWRMPHSRSPSATASTPASATRNGHRRSLRAAATTAGPGAGAGAVSTADIRPVEAGRGRERVAGQRQGVLDVLGARLVRREALAQQCLAVRRVDRDAAPELALRRRVAAGDHAVDARVQDPPRVRHELVVRHRHRPALQARAHLRVAEQRLERGVRVAAEAQLVVEDPEAHPRRGEEHAVGDDQGPGDGPRRADPAGPEHAPPAE